MKKKVKSVVAVASGNLTESCNCDAELQAVVDDNAALALAAAAVTTATDNYDTALANYAADPSDANATAVTDAAAALDTAITMFDIVSAQLAEDEDALAACQDRNKAK